MTKTEYKRIKEQRATAKRRILRAHGYTRDEAKKMAYWGDERLAKEAGVVINPEVYVLPSKATRHFTEYTEQEKRQIQVAIEQRKALEIARGIEKDTITAVERKILKSARTARRRRLLKEQGLPSEVVNRVKKWSEERANPFLEGRYNLPPKDEREFEKRRRLWRQYSNEKSKRDMPEQLKDYAEQINLDDGRKKDHHQGYAIVFYYFVFGGSLDEWQERTKPDPHFAEKYIPPVHLFD